MQTRIKSKILNENMAVLDNGAVLFDDGTEYTRREIDVLKGTGAAPDDIRALHRLKKVFGGELLHEPDPEGDIRRIQLSPTVLPPYVKPPEEKKR